MPSPDSCDFGSDFTMFWGGGAGEARRGSLRCLSASVGFFSAGSVAVASAESELMVTVKGDPAAVLPDAAAGGAGVTAAVAGTAGAAGRWAAVTAAAGDAGTAGGGGGGAGTVAAGAAVTG
jgi:hypothetical protein